MNYYHQIRKEGSELYARLNASLIIALTIIIHLALIYLIIKKYSFLFINQLKMALVIRHYRLYLFFL